MKHATREQYYSAFADILFKTFLTPELGFEKPPIRIHSGWARGARGSTKILGSCYPRIASTDGVNEIFISPTIEDPLVALSTLVHEIVHALDDCKNGHGKPFRRIADKVGLLPPMEATRPSPELSELLEDIASDLGELPDSPMDLPKKATGSRLLKLQCTQCRAIFRASRKVIERMPVPATCPCCGNPTLFSD